LDQGARTKRRWAEVGGFTVVPESWAWAADYGGGRPSTEMLAPMRTISLHGGTVLEMGFGYDGSSFGLGGEGHYWGLHSGGGSR